MITKMVDLICNECGNSFQRYVGEHTRSLKLNRKTYCSRSCTTSANNRSKSRIRNTEGLRSNNRRDELTPFRWYFARARERSRNKGNICLTDLTLEYLKELWENQDGRCPLTGWKMNLADSCLGFKNVKHPQNASLDRIDSEKWYIKGNVRYISLIANYAKGEWNDQWVIDFAEAVMSIV